MTIGVQKMFMQGDFKETRNELDLAIEGDGFFKVMSNEEELYTRAGNFKLNADGTICTPNGDILQPEMTIPTETVSINIDSTGTVTLFDPTGVGGHFRHTRLKWCRNNCPGISRDV
jgi:flagellar basal-body rod protein FlgG